MALHDTLSHEAGLAMEKLSGDQMKFWIFLFEHLFLSLFLLSNIYITKAIKMMNAREVVGMEGIWWRDIFKG